MGQNKIHLGKTLLHHMKIHRNYKGERLSWESQWATCLQTTTYGICTEKLVQGELFLGLGKLGSIINEIPLLNESYENEGKLRFVPRILSLMMSRNMCCATVYWKFVSWLFDDHSLQFEHYLSLRKENGFTFKDFKILQRYRLLNLDTINFALWAVHEL